ncbi:MAG: helix-turn-helix domain-containing protein [Phenylobacterium sp.]|uniref:helix-turn-helix domain-containing protein n=1 Tax=Phenylobacterium sp. TaxID=1871053 RepID=UPI0025CD41F4|nr:helix-turn-helix transcriptional regulator [Phenylobacterium sp.]MBI1197259.1 helix-turn-helix domain-containing protein [Phenylobacterium sp.]
MDDLIAATVGRRIRRRRRLLGLTQQGLGQACGVTFQQVQKYETATCRVSAPVLWKLARALDVDVGYFFLGLEEEIAAEPPAKREPTLRLAV